MPDDLEMLSEMCVLQSALWHRHTQHAHARACKHNGGAEATGRRHVAGSETES